MPDRITVNIARHREEIAELLVEIVRKILVQKLQKRLSKWH